MKEKDPKVLSDGMIKIQKGNNHVTDLAGLYALHSLESIKTKINKQTSKFQNNDD